MFSNVDVRRSVPAVIARAVASVAARLLLLTQVSLAGVAPPLWAQTAPNSDPTYQALRNLTVGSESVRVTNLDLKRDKGTFHLHSGSVCFAAPVQGKVTGAVFTGNGNFVLDAPPSEGNMLKLLTNENEFSESFTEMTLRFTDSTYDEIKKAGQAASEACKADAMKDSQRVTRTKLKENLEARILEDLLSPEPGGLFVAFIHGKRYNDKERFTIDPHQAGDQVQLMTYDENKLGIWGSFNLSGEHKEGTVGMPIRIEHQELDTTIENNATLTGKATTTFVAGLGGMRVVAFDLFP
jgi:hypothetical protein